MFLIQVYASMPSLREMFESFDASQEGPTCTGLLTGYCFPPFFTRNVLNSGVQVSNTGIGFRMSMFQIAIKRTPKPNYS